MSLKAYQALSAETLKGRALKELAQSSVGSDDVFGLAMNAGGGSFTGVGGVKCTATGSVALGNVITVTAFGDGDSPDYPQTYIQAGAAITDDIASPGGGDIPAATTIVLQLTSTEADGHFGGKGTYQLSAALTGTMSSAAVYVAAALVTVTAVASGTLGGGQVVSAGTGLTGTPTIVEQELPLVAGESQGGVGRYVVSTVQTFASTADLATAAAATALVDGDSWAIFQGLWQGRKHYESNQDVFSKFARKYVVKLCGATSLTVADGSLVPTTPGVVTAVGITAHGFVAGEAFMVGTEAFFVVAVPDANTVSVLRGYAGTTIATHAMSASVLAPASWANVNVGYDIPLPVTALAIATSGTQVAAAMNAVDGFNPKWNGQVSPSNGVQKFGKKYGFTWEYVSSGTRFIAHRQSVSGVVGPDSAAHPAQNPASATDVFILWSVTNGFGGEQPYAGVQIMEVGRSVVLRAVTAGEVAAGGGFGQMDFAFPYPITSWAVKATVVSSRASAVDTNWVVTFSADFRRATITGVTGHTLGAVGVNLVGLDVTF